MIKKSPSFVTRAHVKQKLGGRRMYRGERNSGGVVMNAVVRSSYFVYFVTVGQ